MAPTSCIFVITFDSLYITLHSKLCTNSYMMSYYYDLIIHRQINSMVKFMFNLLQYCTLSFNCYIIESQLKMEPHEESSLELLSAGVTYTEINPVCVGGSDNLSERYLFILFCN